MAENSNHNSSLTAELTALINRHKPLVENGTFDAALLAKLQAAMCENLADMHIAMATGRLSNS